MGAHKSKEGSKVRSSAVCTNAKAIEGGASSEGGTHNGAIRMLLLGAGGGGKSTILKQMRIIYGNGFEQLEMDKYKEIIQRGIIEQMRNILAAMHSLQMEFTEASLTYAAEHVIGVFDQRECMPLSPGSSFSLMTITAVRQLWADPGVKGVTRAGGNDFAVNESAAYFFDHLDRIVDDRYVPTYQDILYTRTHTTGLVQVPIQMSGKQFLILDVGGQRSERRKWIHYFDNVAALMFVVAMSDFDKHTTNEDETKKNCFVESLEVFESVVNLKMFGATSMIVYMNKLDLFVEKVNEGKSIREVFPHYYADYLIDRFLAKNNDPRLYIYTHQVCATDTEQIGSVLQTTLNSVLAANINKCFV